ncbi:hypothetical protein JTB14_036704 [Gonioctena quinquepunctata]|nr:hypothetical protein JTB14_036704 [Gonioctena quinquepunctata]
MQEGKPPLLPDLHITKERDREQTERRRLHDAEGAAVKPLEEQQRDLNEWGLCDNEEAPENSTDIGKGETKEGDRGKTERRRSHDAEDEQAPTLVIEP